MASEIDQASRVPLVDTGEVTLRLDRVSRVANGKRLVDDVTLEVQSGSVVAIVGPSGAGKSSLLRLINRLDEPTAGTVYVEGEDYRNLEPQELRRRVGMVMQSAHLFRGTVVDNIRFGPRQRGQELALETIEGLLARVGLEGYADRDVSNLSGGEAQRVSLARTLANSPRVLLLDEPTSALDEAAQLGVEELICSILRAEQLTCLIVTHDTDQARRMASHEVEMVEGRVVRYDRLEEV
jgi:putative ABC transport system ATP-binding protein